jgi:hypothetical protein
MTRRVHRVLRPAHGRLRLRNPLNESETPQS